MTQVQDHVNPSRLKIWPIRQNNDPETSSAPKLLRCRMKLGEECSLNPSMGTQYVMSSLSLSQWHHLTPESFNSHKTVMSTESHITPLTIPLMNSHNADLFPNLSRQVWRTHFIQLILPNVTKVATTKRSPIEKPPEDNLGGWVDSIQHCYRGQMSTATGR